MSKKNLVIIESPYKEQTIKKYLGSNYKIVASMGHLRDLPKSRLGVDVEHDFKPEYINIRGKGDLIKKLKKEAEEADTIFFATDPDREGEAISWHLATVLAVPQDKARRVCFNELTKNAIKAAIKEPRPIDMDLVNSQQTRRILDRLVGYNLSPLLWKIRSGLSAGRVQSVATRIIVDRENEINAFLPDEYWTVDAEFRTKNGQMFTARHVGRNGEKDEINNAEQADGICADVDGRDAVITSVKKNVRQKIPQAPFTTSTLQQEASRKLGMRAKRTMQVAQELYEGIDLGHQNGGAQGLITYMRTDSLRISDEAASDAEKYIEQTYGREYVPSARRAYKAKGKVQDAHEAIRPTDMGHSPDSIKEYLTPDQYRLYRLIWNRFVSSLMAPAEYDTTTVDIECGKHNFRVTGSVMIFRGFLAEYDSGDDEDRNTFIPSLSVGERVTCGKIKGEQHFTEPPMRFTEGSLVKFLEEKGIGRPSTYATTVSTIVDRGYVTQDGKTLKPTELGKLTNDIMTANFPDIIDYAFTANLEEGLDDIAGGTRDMLDLLRSFYADFENELEKARNKLSSEKISAPVVETDIICEKCGAKMVIRQGKRGKFAACPNYPACKNTKSIDQNGNIVENEKKEPELIGEKCEKCGAELVKRTGRYGEFIACSNYPVCDYTREIVHPTGTVCPLCGGQIVSRFSKKGTQYYGCSNYPSCSLMLWDRPTGEKCPDCGSLLVMKKSGRIVCSNKECGFRKNGEKND